MWRNWLHCANTAVKNKLVPKAKLQTATIGGSADEIEAAFYDALQSGDIERLMACWADEEDIVCVHPGGPRLLGADSIRNSFEAMFAKAQAAPANAAPFADGDMRTLRSLGNLVSVLGVIKDE